MPGSASDQATLTAWCITLVAEMVERAPSEIDPNVKFARMGLDSAMAVQLAIALEQHLDMVLSPDVIADHPTIAKLAAYLTASRPPNAAERP